MSIDNYFSSKWSSLKELLVMGLLEGISRKPGIVLRNLLYRNVLARLGNSVQIEQGVKFLSARSIEIGNEVTLACNCSLNSYGQKNRIVIGDRVRLESNVSINTAGQKNWVLLGEQVQLDSNVSLNCFPQNSKISLKKKVWLEQGVVINSRENGYVEIGEYSYIGAYGCLAGPGHIRIGKNCLIASHAGIFANHHIFTDPTRTIGSQGLSCKGVVIEDDCWLGSGVKVLDGVTIGRGSVIGAGAVVTKDIPPFSVAVGVPARVIAQREEKRFAFEKTLKQ